MPSLVKLTNSAQWSEKAQGFVRGTNIPGGKPEFLYWFKRMNGGEFIGLTHFNRDYIAIIFR